MEITSLLFIAETYTFVCRDVIVANLAAQMADVNIERARADNNPCTPNCIENLLTGKDTRFR